MLFSPSDNNRLVRAERHQSGPTTTLQIDLWGTTIAEADIPNILRRRFAELGSATISAATVLATRPTIDGDGGVHGRRIIRREIRGSP